MKKQTESMNSVALEGDLEPFLGRPELDMQQLFEGERFPNVVVALDGAVLATWGRDHLMIRRSEDGGRTWPIKRLVYEGASAYSSLNAGRPGTSSEGWIYLQFEEPQAGGRMARFNLSWLTDGERTGDGRLPEGLGR